MPIIYYNPCDCIYLSREEVTMLIGFPRTRWGFSESYAVRISVKISRICELNRRLVETEISLESWVNTMTANVLPACVSRTTATMALIHNDVIKGKHFRRYWSFVRGIHRRSVNSPKKGQWRGTLMFSLICAWTNGWANNRDISDSRRHRAHFYVTVMKRLLVFHHEKCQLTAPFQYWEMLRKTNMVLCFLR